MKRRIRFLFLPAGANRLNEPIRVVVPRADIRTTDEADAHHWSPTEVEMMSAVTDHDLADARAWLARIDVPQALAAFDS
jgi:hypothetical protein